MDKNQTIGLVLIAGIFIGFSYFTQPSAEEKAERAKQELAEKQKSYNDSVAQAKAAIAAEKKHEENLTDTTNAFYASHNGENKTLVLKNKNVELGIQTKGGLITSAKLKGYKNQQKKDVELFNAENANMKFVFPGKNDNISTSDLYFSPVEANDSSVILRANANNGYIEFAYKLPADGYMTNMSIRFVGLENQFSPATKTFDILWNERLAQQEKGHSFESRYSSITYKKSEGGSDYIGDSGEASEEISEKLDWIAFKNQFFSYVFITDNAFTQTSIASVPEEKGTGYLKNYSATTKAEFDPTGKNATTFQFYTGPNNYRLLQSTNELSTSGKELELERLVYLGWPLFRWINRWFTIYVFDFLTGIGLHMGIVLLLITLLMKVITYPFVRKSFMASAKMRVLKPKIDAINEKYKDPADAMKKQQEMMQLYSQYGANPMGGCLPMLIQMPLWLAMFNFVPNAIELRGQSFLWAEDLSTYDSIISWDNSIWLIGDHISLFCILFSASNILYTILSMRQQRDTMTGQQADQMKMMQWMMYIMPVAFFFMLNEYSSGLNYYYCINLLFSAIIMWVMRKTTDDQALLAKLEANYEQNKNKPNKMSGLAKRMEQLQKMQEERMARIEKYKKQ